jgi:hypothetical protein
VAKKCKKEVKKGAAISFLLASSALPKDPK